MSINLLNEPSNAISAVENRVTWDYQSDRVTDLATTVSSIATSGGFAKYTLSAVHNIQIGDTVIGSGISADYNVKQQVTAVDQLTVTTDLAYVDDQSGTLTRDHNSFRMKATVYKGVGEHEVISSTATNGGNTKFTLAATSAIIVGDLVAVSGTDKNYPTFSAVNDDAGKVEYDCGAHAIPVGAVIIVSGVTVDTDYNKTQRVIAVTATKVTTDVDSGSTTGSPTDGEIDWAVYDGVHTATVVSGADVTVDTAYITTMTTGIVNECTLIGSKKQEQITDGSDSIFRFNLSNYLKSELSFDLAVHTTTNEVITDNSSSVINYSVTYTEQFEDKAGLIIDGLSVQSNCSKKVINAAIQQTATQNLNTYTVDGSSNLFLTNQPASVLYQIGDVLQLHFLYTGSGTIRGTVIEMDENFTTVVATYASSYVTIIADRGIFKVDTSIFNAATVYADIEIQSAGVLKSETKRIKVDRFCADRTISVTWLNRLGGFDRYRFKGDLVEMISVNKSSYLKPLPNGFAANDRGESVIGSSAFDTRSIYSDWISQTEADWLAELFTSKVVYLIEDIGGTDTYVPIIITDTRQNLSKSRGMTQLRMSYTKPQLLING